MFNSLDSLINDSLIISDEAIPEKKIKTLITENIVFLQRHRQKNALLTN